MSDRTLKIRGVSLELCSDGSDAAEACIDELRADFAAWSATGAMTEPSGVVVVRLSAVPRTARNGFGPRLFKTRMASARGLGPRRLVEYGDGCSASLDASDPFRPEVEIHASDPDLLREIAYTTCLSLLGDVFDRQGFHRVHGLGISVASRGVLCIFGEKSGKSTLAMALKLSGDRELRFHSDETPLLKDGCLHPYPNRLALGEAAVKVFGERLPAGRRTFRRKLFGTKELFAFEPDEVASGSTPIGAVLLDGGRGFDRASITPVGRARALFALTDAMVVGRGVTQMAEFFLRLDPRNLVSLSGIALSRAREATRVAAGTRGYIFRRSNDPDENARVLLEFGRNAV